MCEREREREKGSCLYSAMSGILIDSEKYTNKVHTTPRLLLTIVEDIKNRSYAPELGTHGIRFTCQAVFRELLCQNGFRDGESESERERACERERGEGEFTCMILN